MYFSTIVALLGFLNKNNCVIYFLQSVSFKQILRKTSLKKLITQIKNVAHKNLLARAKR